MNFFRTTDMTDTTDTTIWKPGLKITPFLAKLVVMAAPPKSEMMQSHQGMQYTEAHVYHRLFGLICFGASSLSKYTPIFDR